MPDIACPVCAAAPLAPCIPMAGEIDAGGRHESRGPAPDDLPAPVAEDPAVAEANRLIAMCLRRRCSECPTRGHHWLCDFIDPDDPEAVAEWIEAHPQAASKAKSAAFLSCHVTCKHCPAVKRWQGEDH